MLAFARNKGLILMAGDLRIASERFRDAKASEVRCEGRLCMFVVGPCSGLNQGYVLLQ